MKKLLGEYGFKILYGKTTKSWNNFKENWIGIKKEDFGNEKHRTIIYQENPLKIRYCEQGEKIKILSVGGGDCEVDMTYLYLAFPLLKLMEKAEKNGIKEIEIANDTYLLKALSAFVVEQDRDNEKNKKTFKLKKEKVTEMIKIFEIIMHHSSIWRVKHISSNISFRTRSGNMDIIWNDQHEKFTLRKLDETNIWRNDIVLMFDTAKELEDYLRKLELSEVFQPLSLENIKKMYCILKPKQIWQCTEEELKQFYNHIEKFTKSLEESPRL